MFLLYSASLFLATSQGRQRPALPPVARGRIFALQRGGSRRCGVAGKTRSITSPDNVGVTGTGETTLPARQMRKKSRPQSQGDGRGSGCAGHIVKGPAPASEEGCARHRRIRRRLPVERNLLRGSSAQAQQSETAHWSPARSCARPFGRSVRNDDGAGQDREDG
jgi:hypothetical protein